MDFGKAIDELKREINVVFDDDLVRGIDLYAKRGALTYWVGNVNSIALKERQTAPADLQAIIDRQLREVNAYANKAFERIEYLIENPLPSFEKQPKVGKINPNGGAKPKASAEPEKPPAAPVPTNEFEETNPFVELESSVAPEMGMQTDGEERLLNAIYAKIRAEFDRIRSASPKEDETDLSSKNQSVKDETIEINKKQCEIEHPSMLLKFDRVQLSSFAGDYTEWISFRDEFLQLVHTNPKLSDVVKFHQLKTHLRGIALDAINGFKLCAADYNAAWQTLVQRYDNDYRIVTEYIKKFFELPVLGANPSNAQFLQMLNRTNQLIRVLPAFGYDVTSWDPIIMYCLLARMDSHFIGKWNDQIKKRQRIPLSELMEFLEIQAAEIVAATNDRPRMAQQVSRNKPAKKGKKSAHVMLTVSNDSKNTEQKCAQCGNAHLTFGCKTFLALPVSERIKKIKAAKHCIKCMNKHVSGEQCTFKPCRYCTKAHNNLLCLQHEKEVQNEAETQTVSQPNAE